MVTGTGEERPARDGGRSPEREMGWTVYLSLIFLYLCISICKRKGYR